MINKKTGLLVSSTLIASFALAPIASAQMDVIVVTAQKRKSTLQETPIAMSALSIEAMNDAQISDVQDMQALIPSLNVPQFAAPAQTTIRIRGLGTAGFNAGLEPSVGVFIDGVYRSRVGAALNDMIDVERVEVLRGPQSTIYGKNTPAGVISILTQKPALEFDAGTEFTFGNYKQRILKGYITDAVGDSETLSYRLSGVLNIRDGFIENMNDGSDINNRDRFGIRGQILFEPRDDISMRFIADYNKINENCCAAPFVFHDPDNFKFITLLGANLGPVDPFKRRVNVNGKVLTENKTSGLSAEIVKSFDSFDVTSITAFRKFEEISDIDADFIDIDLTQRRSLDDNYTTFTQELRLTSTGDNAVDWMVGGYYFSQDLFAANNTIFGSDLRKFANFASKGLVAGLEGAYAATGEIPNVVPGSTFFAAGTGLNAKFNQDSESYAVFGTADWHVTEQLTVSGGLRYTNETKSVNAKIVNDSFSQIDLKDTAVALTIGGIVQKTLPGAAAAAAADSTSPFFGAPVAAIMGHPGFIAAVTSRVTTAVGIGINKLKFFPVGSSAFTDTRSEDNVSGNVTVSYNWSDNFNVYGKYSRGFKAGGFNLSNRSRAGAGTFDAETITAYELGLKARLFDNRVRLSLAGFDQRLHGQQVAIFNGTTFDLNNAGDVSIQGVEWDIQAAPSDNLFVTFAGSYLNGKYNSFDKGPCTAGERAIAGHACQVKGFQDFSGKKLDNLAKWNLAASAKYTVPIGKYEGFIRGEATYRSEFNPKADLDPVGKQPSTVFLNASVGIADADDLWDVSLWGRNLTDEKVLQGVFNSVGQTGSFNGYPNDPTTYGVTLRLHY
ncbi:MAG: TonB-dependent receptor [Robiginitomaculum sp.]